MAEPNPQATPTPRPRNRRWLLLALLAVVLAGGGVAGWYFTQAAPAPSPDPSPSGRGDGRTPTPNPTLLVRGRVTTTPMTSPTTPDDLPTPLPTVAAFEVGYRIASRPDRDPDLVVGSEYDRRLSLIYHSQQLTGRWEAASAAYRAILADNAAPRPAQREAIWRLGQCNLAGGSYLRAVELYQQFQQAYPDDERSRRLDYLTADAYNYAGDYVQAAEAYRRYLTNAGPLWSFTLLRLAEAEARAGNLIVAAETFDQVAASSASSTAEMREALAGTADVALRQRNYAAAVTAYEYSLTLTQPGGRSAVELKLANAQLAAGQHEVAADHYLAIIRRAPDNPTAYPALQQLLTFSPTVLTDGTLNYYLAGQMAFAAGANDVAINYFRSYLDSNEAEFRPESLLYAALAYERLGNDERAAANFGVLIADHPTAAAATAGYLGLGRLAERRGDCQAAILNYALASTRTDDPAGLEAAFRLGLCRFKLGEYATALTNWQPLTSSSSSEMRAQALYWSGRAAAAVGRDPLPFYRQTAALPAPYYAALAIARLDGLDGKAQPPPTNLEQLRIDSANEQTYLGSTTRWLRGMQPTAVLTTDLLVAANPDVSRIAELLRLGERIYAYRELSSGVLDRLVEAGDYAGLASLTLYARYRDEPYVAMILARRLVEAVPADALPLATLLERSRYPTPFADAMLAAAQEAVLDPLLLYAVARQESNFNPYARSGADARGLMQVIPSTAAEIARNLGEADFATNDLYRPLVAARYGAAYLRDRLLDVGGSVVRAAAGYNAGGGSLAQWSSGAAATDDDLFVENITYPETAEYVRIVYANYVSYRRLYAAGELSCRYTNIAARPASARSASSTAASVPQKQVANPALVAAAPTLRG